MTSSKAAKPITSQELARAKFALWQTLVLDTGRLSFLAHRVAGLLVCKYMSAFHGGEAWATIAAYCEDLGLTSHRHVREALSLLCARNYFEATHVPGRTTRYRIAARFFSMDTPPQIGAECNDETSPRFRADPASEQFDPAPFSATHPAPFSSSPLAPKRGAHPAPNRGDKLRERTPGTELRGINTGNTPRKARRGDYDPSFLNFYAAYPRKVGKPSAAKAFAKAVKAGKDPEMLVAVATAYADWCRQVRQEERFIPHPSRWLNDERYDNPLPPFPRGRGAGPTPEAELLDQIRTARQAQEGNYAFNGPDGDDFRVLEGVEYARG